MKRHPALALLPLVLPLLVAGIHSGAHATDYDEALLGDLAYQGQLYTLALTPGHNQVWGSVSVAVSAAAPTVVDHDWLALSVAPGQQLVQISAQAWDLDGNMNWVRWWLFDTNTADADEVAPVLLPELQPFSPGVDQINGAWGPGLYQLRNLSMSWFGLPTDSSARAGYRLDFVVRDYTPPVPEPSSWLMLLAGLGLLRASRRQTRGRRAA